MEDNGDSGNKTDLQGEGNVTDWLSEGEDEGNETNWHHPPQYVLMTRWCVEGVLLPVVGVVGIIGGCHCGLIGGGMNECVGCYA